MDTGRRLAAGSSVKGSPADRLGRQIETYGSEGWGFESLRVRHVMSRDIVEQVSRDIVAFLRWFGISAVMVAPSSPGSRPGHCGWTS